MADESYRPCENAGQDPQTGQSTQPTQPDQFARPTQQPQSAYPTQSGQSSQQQPSAQGAYQGSYQATYGGPCTSTPPAYNGASTPAYNSGPTYDSNYEASSRPGTGATTPPAGPAPVSHQPNHQKDPKRGSAGKTFLVAFAGALVACVLAFGIASVAGVFGDGASTSTTIGSTTSSSIDADDEDVTLAEAVAEKALPSVVCVYVYTNESSYSTFGFGYGSSTDSGSETLTQSALGSGVVLSEDGYIITNYHVVEDADALRVTIEGTEYDAEVVGYDSSSDIAVIKAVDATGLTAIEIGDSDDIRVGQWVMTIGAPYGYEQSVATGVVSATSRSTVLSDETTGETTIYTNLIQTDAAINSGNSGGAMVNSDGQLIGINTLISSSSGGSDGIGFAIPANYAVGIAEQIINGETPTHAQLGVSLTTISSQVANMYGLSTDSGAYVSAVVSGSGADEAGIEVGDIIVGFDGEAVESASDVLIAVRSHETGETVTVTVNRDGEEIDLEVTLGSDESSTSTSGSSFGSLLDQSSKEAA